MGRDFAEKPPFTSPSPFVYERLEPAKWNTSEQPWQELDFLGEKIG